MNTISKNDMLQNSASSQLLASLNLPFSRCFNTRLIRKGAGILYVRLCCVWLLVQFCLSFLDELIITLKGKQDNSLNINHSFTRLV